MCNLFQELADTTEDSDSDVEDVRNVVEKSQSQLELAENLFARSNNGTKPDDCVCILPKLFLLPYYLTQSLYRFVDGLVQSIKNIVSRVHCKITTKTSNVIRLCERMRYFLVSLVWPVSRKYRKYN